MKNIIAAGNLFLKKMDLTDMALLKVCVGALGVLVGLGVAKSNKKPVATVAGCLFAGTFLPLAGKFFQVLTDTEGD